MGAPVFPVAPLGLEFGPAIIPPATAQAQPIIRNVDVWAGDLIQINFDEPVVVNDDLRNPAHYTIVGVGDSAGLPQVAVVGVRVGNEPITASVFLIVGPFQIGGDYQVTASTTIVGVTGLPLNASFNSARFIGRRTKIDDGIGHRPHMYDIEPGSLDRELYNAIMRSDDLLGGERNDNIGDNLGPVAAASTGVVITPTTATVPLGAKQQYSAKVFGIANQAVNWFVNGIAGGDGTVGTIDATGLYTAPLAMPIDPVSSITAVSVADPTKEGGAFANLVAAVVDHIFLNPANTTCAIGGTRSMQAVAVFTDGSTLDVSLNANTTWRSFRPEIADFGGLRQLLLNGGFEKGDFTSWVTSVGGGQIVAVRTQLNDQSAVPFRLVNPQEGGFFAQIGDTAPHAGTARVKQQIAVPATGTTTLKFFGNFRSLGGPPGDHQLAEIRDAADAVTLATIFDQTNNARVWVETTVDLTPYAGTTITLRFSTTDDGVGGQPTYWFLDNVRVFNTVPVNVLQAFAPGLSDELGGTPVTFTIEATYLGVAGSTQVTVS